MQSTPAMLVLQIRARNIQKLNFRTKILNPKCCTLDSPPSPLANGIRVMVTLVDYISADMNTIPTSSDKPIENNHPALCRQR